MSKKREALFGKPVKESKDILPKEGENPFAKKADDKKDDKPEDKKESDMEAKKEDEAMPEQKPEHDDAEQDKALILQMIKKYMSGEEDPSAEPAEKKEDESHQSEDEACMKAYEGYKEMGYAHDECMKQAAHAMKLAKHLSSKQTEAKESEKKEDEAKHESEKKEDESKHESEKKEDEAKHESEDEAKKESMAKLVARNAFLEKEFKKIELEKVLDTKLRESKLGRAETDKIRALIGEPKNEAEITKTIKIFTEALGVSVGSESKQKNIFVTSVEKTNNYTSGEKKVFSFSDCKK
jgi:hypothetical protein